MSAPQVSTYPVPFFPAEIDERMSMMIRGLRKWQRGFPPHLTFQIFHEVVPFSKGSVPHLCHARPRYQVHRLFRRRPQIYQLRGNTEKGRVAPARMRPRPISTRWSETAPENALLLPAKAFKECGQRLRVLTARQGIAMVRRLPIAPRTHVLKPTHRSAPLARQS